MKGILLAGGSGTRLSPLTLTTSKQLLPIYDKPMIYYPLSTLMLAGIQDILIISTPRDLPLIETLLGSGQEFGLNLSYCVQKSPDGIAQSFLLGEKFLSGSPSCLVLGDNIFFGHDLSKQLESSSKLETGARVFAYHVHDPERYGVVSFDQNGQATAIEEKPKNPKSKWAVTGLYFYDDTVVSRARSLKPSPRGELEITDLNKSYLEDQNLSVEKLGRGTAWLDCGTPDSLLNCAQFVQTLEKRQGLKIACLEEISFHKGWISANEVLRQAERCGNSPYGLYLKTLLQ